MPARQATTLMQRREMLRLVEEEGYHHAPNNIAKRVLDFSTTVSRERLRPQYGDGFAGAPLAQDRGVKPDETRRTTQENTDDQSKI